MAVRYITVTPVTNMFKPATRSFGDIAVIGATDGSAAGPANTPVVVTNPDSVSHADNPAGDGLPVDAGEWFSGALGASVRLCFGQTPGPIKVYAVKADPADTTQLAAALTQVSKLSVQFVVLANTPLTASAGQAPIESLASHVDTVSNTGGDGKERMGVAMLGKGVTAADTLITGNMAKDRIVMVAHHSDQDAAAAYAGTIAGYEPHISILLKQVNIGMDDLFTDAEIDLFNENRVNWLTDPQLLPGKGIFSGEGYTLGADKPYIDIVRTIDDISFRLKARLIRTIGNLRISRSGLRNLESQMAAILQPLVDREVIEAYDIFIPILVLLDKSPASLTDMELIQINSAQNDRVVDVIVAVDYAGAIHRLNITLKFE